MKQFFALTLSLSTESPESLIYFAPIVNPGAIELIKSVKSRASRGWKFGEVSNNSSMALAHYKVGQSSVVIGIASSVQIWSVSDSTSRSRFKQS